VYRLINPTSEQVLPIRMLFEPEGDGTFLRACEADGPRALVAAIMEDPGYEIASTAARLRMRLRMAQDIQLLAGIDGRALAVADRDGPDVINVHSDREFIASLNRLGFVSVGNGGGPA